MQKDAVSGNAESLYAMYRHIDGQHENTGRYAHGKSRSSGYMPGNRHFATNTIGASAYIPTNNGNDLSMLLEIDRFAFKRGIPGLLLRENQEKSA